jgi:hypothetical protein
VVEEVITHFLGLTPINTGGPSPVIFDAHHAGVFYEIKSLRRTSALPVYEWRREKDRTCGVPLLYVIAIHNVTGAADVSEVWSRMAETIRKVLIVPASTIDRLAGAEDLRMLKSEKKSARSGYHREGYKEGYRNIPARKIVEEAPHFVTRQHGVLNHLQFDFEIFTQVAGLDPI